MRTANLGFPVIVLAIASLVLAGPSPASEARAAASKDAVAVYVREGYKAARNGRWQRAQAAFAAALREDLKNPRLHFLNGLAYDVLGRAGRRDQLDLARVGYQSAARFGQGQFWPQLYLGYLELERRDYLAAQEAFAAAVREQPGRWEAHYGLGVASYYSGDVLAARLAAARCEELASDSVAVLRLVAFARAAAADPDSRHAAAAYARSDRSDRYVERRIVDVLRKTRLEQIADAQASATEDTSGDAADMQSQILVDVTIILSSLLDMSSRGVNLFDGLAAQYGYSNQYSANRASGSPWGSNRSITSSITVPQLSYSLNLFNDSGQHYQVLARPSLTAYLGRDSEFFAGRTINVKVSGVNLGTLQPIDVGVGLKVTPESIDGEQVTFRVSASRSFLSREEIGTFDESLTTFKQLVSATAQVAFGQTLLLSALSESVRDATFSKVPLLGDIPGPSLLLRERLESKRQESLVILLTPMRPTAIATNDRLRPAAVEALIDTWQKVVEPRSDVRAILRDIQRSRFFRATESGDLKWSQAMTPQLLDEALRENVELTAT